MKLPVDYDGLMPPARRAVREEYVRLQEGRCHYCKLLLSGLPTKQVMGLAIREDLFPRGFFQHPIHLHHSHDTGKTIGAVHARCNAVLWQYHGE